jgi:hypothetical protein
MTNTKFLAVRKCYGFEWECYKDKRSNGYIAICHSFSKSVSSDTWDGIWDEILNASKQKRKNQRTNKGRKK